MATPPWYTRYDSLRQELTEKKEIYLQRVKELGVDEDIIMKEIWIDLIAKTVHESNWQEGLYLDEAETRIITEDIFRGSSIQGPHLDIEEIIINHRNIIRGLAESGSSIERIATYNLAYAHLMLSNVHSEMLLRFIAGFRINFKRERGLLEQITNSQDVLPYTINEILSAYDDLEEAIYSHEYAFSKTMTDGVKTSAELLNRLERIDIAHLTRPLHIEYLHFLHKIILMGAYPFNRTGEFRQDPAHLTGLDLEFPLPSTIPRLMEEFCLAFPVISLFINTESFPEEAKDFTYTIKGIAEYGGDIILNAAKFSYRFVRIHPYEDGNGRMSRLLMNLILYRHFPPVPLKADPKGKDRYAYALKRANRGNIKPLACLIAMSLIEIYDQLIDAVNP